MANASILAMKEQHVAEIKDRLTRAQSVVMFDYRGLTVDEVTALRVEMRKAGVEYIVLKNTMVERACRELNIDESVHAMLKGPSAFAFGYDDAVIEYYNGEKETASQDISDEVYEGGKDYWGFQHKKQIEQFYRACLNLEPLKMSGEEALKTHKLICDIYGAGKKFLSVK